MIVPKKLVFALLKSQEILTFSSVSLEN